MDLPNALAHIYLFQMIRTHAQYLAIASFLKWTLIAIWSATSVLITQMTVICKFRTVATVATQPSKFTQIFAEEIFMDILITIADEMNATLTNLF